MGHQLFQLRRVQAGGRAAADIEGADMQPGAVGGPADGGQLLTKLINIGLHKRAGGLIPHRAGDKAAVAAPGRAERDTRIDAAVHRVGGVQNRLLQVGDAEREGELFRCAAKVVKEARAYLVLPRTGCAHVVNDAHRPHTGHHAPGRRDAGRLAEHTVQQPAQGVLRILALRAQGGFPLQPSVEAQQGQIGAAMALRQHKITLLREIFRLLRTGEKQPCGMLSFIARCGAA